jgi:hypothetical protein
MMLSWPAWIGARWSLCFWICDSERPSDRRQARPGFPESSSNVHQAIFFEASFLDVTSGSKIQNPGSGPLAVPAGQCEDPLSGSWILDLQKIAFFGEIRRVKSKIQDPSDLPGGGGTLHVTPKNAPSTWRSRIQNPERLLQGCISLDEALHLHSARMRSMEI